MRVVIYVNQVVYGRTQLSRRECTVSSTALRYVSLTGSVHVIVLSSTVVHYALECSTWYESLTMPLEALVQALVSRDRSHIF